MYIYACGIYNFLYVSISVCSKYYRYFAVVKFDPKTIPFSLNFYSKLCCHFPPSNCLRADAILNYF